MSRQFLSFFFIFVSISLPAFSMADTPFRACPSDLLGKLIDVKVGGCNKAPCILRRGSDIKISVDFTTNSTVDKVEDEVKGIIQGIPVPFPIENPNACLNKGISCPLVQGKKYSYVAVTPVSRSYPSLRLIVQWSIVNKDKKKVFCVEIPVSIK